MGVPADLRYTKSHEWARLEGGKVVVGITDFAVAAIKEIVFLELPPLGRAVEAAKPFGVIESVKAVFDLKAPVSGKVAEVNAKMAEDFEALARDPFVQGWLVKLEAPGADLSGLMDAAAYEKFCAEEHH